MIDKCKCETLSTFSEDFKTVNELMKETQKKCWHRLEQPSCQQLLLKQVIVECDVSPKPKEGLDLYQARCFEEYFNDCGLPREEKSDMDYLLKCKVATMTNSKNVYDGPSRGSGQLIIG